jgi:endogenous inhibitor of DNA gyrase (YacG/DUF329 family)
MANRFNPCKGCADRYPACSGKCKKPEFLAWKSEQEKIRANRAKYQVMDGYTVDQIHKSRRK